MTTIIDTPNYQFVEATHTKKGSKLYVIQLKNKVEDKFKLLTRRVENHGGYYSGHQKGFVFNRILSQKEIDEIFKGIFFEEKVELQKVDENKDAWNYTLEELKSIPVSKRGEDTFNFKYNLDGKLVNYSIKVPSGSTDDAFISLAKKIIGNALMSGKYNKAVEKGEITPVRAAQIIKSLGYSLEQINQDFVELHPDIQAVWSMKKANQEEVLDKVRFPYLYERSEMSHLSDKRYSQIINDAIDSNKYEKLIKEGTVSANKVAFIIESAGFEIPEGLLGEAISERKEEIESLVGGYADSQSIYDISEKHGVPIKEIIRQFKKGLKVEREHTKDKQKMGEIVKDHLVENPYYYDVLIQAEKTMEELDPSKFKSHDEYMKAFSEKERELEGLSVEEKVELKARTIIDKIKYAHKQIGDGVPDEVESFLKNQILNHFVSLFNEVVSEYIFYTPVWLDLQNEYLTESQRNKMLMYGIYNNAHYEEDVVNKFIENVIDSEMIFGSENKKLNNIFNLLPYSPFEVPSELEYDLNPKDKNLAEIVDAFVNKTKVLTSTLGVYFGKDGVFASKFTLDIFLKGKKGYLPKNNIEEGIYGLSNSAKNILPAYGAKRLNMLKDKKAIQFFQEYMATYGNEKGEFDKGISVLTHDQIQTMFKDMSVVYWNKAYKDYVKKEVDGLKLKVSSYSVLYIKQGANLFTICLHDFIEALAAIIKMGIDTVQFGVSKNGLYISENVSSLIRLEESGIRVSIKSNESEMPHGMLYYDLNKKEFLTNKVEKNSMEGGGDVSDKPKIVVHNNTNSASDKDAQKIISEYLKNLNDSGRKVFIEFLKKSNQNIKDYEAFFYVSKDYHDKNSNKFYSNKIIYQKNIEDAYKNAINYDDAEPSFIRIYRHGNIIGYAAVTEFDLFGDWDGDKYDEKGYLKKELKEQAIKQLKKNLFVEDISEMKDGGGVGEEKINIRLDNELSVFKWTISEILSRINEDKSGHIYTKEDWMIGFRDKLRKKGFTLIDSDGKPLNDSVTNGGFKDYDNSYGEPIDLPKDFYLKGKRYTGAAIFVKGKRYKKDGDFITTNKFGLLMTLSNGGYLSQENEGDDFLTDSDGYGIRSISRTGIIINIDNNGVKIYSDGGDIESDEKKWVDCPRCGGSGELPMYRHINAGVCFECGGKGVVPNKSAVEIVERMRLSKKKNAEKRKLENEKQKAYYDAINKRKEDFAINFNNNIIEKVIIPNTEYKYLFQENRGFKTILALFNSLGVKDAEGFLKALKDYGKQFLDPIFESELAKYLHETYNYNYIKEINKEYLKDFFLFESNYRSYLNKKQNEIIALLFDKYSPQYEKIGRYDDDVIEDRPSGSRMEDGGEVKNNLEKIFDPVSWNYGGTILFTELISLLNKYNFVISEGSYLNKETNLYESKEKELKKISEVEGFGRRGIQFDNGLQLEFSDNMPYDFYGNPFVEEDKNLPDYLKQSDLGKTKNTEHKREKKLIVTVDISYKIGVANEHLCTFEIKELNVKSIDKGLKECGFEASTSTSEESFDNAGDTEMKDGGLLTKKRRNKLVVKPYTGYEFAKYLKKLGYIEKDGSYKVEVLVIGDGDENDRTFEIELYDYDSVSAIGTNFYDEDQDTMEVFFKDIEYVLKDLNA